MAVLRQRLLKKVFLPFTGINTVWQQISPPCNSKMKFHFCWGVNKYFLFLTGLNGVYLPMQLRD
jgi:hypothetical protein